MNWFLGKVEFSSPCLVPNLYCWVSEIKYVIKHIIFLGSPCPLSTLGIGMATLSRCQWMVKSECIWILSCLPVLINCCHLLSVLSEFGLILHKVHMCICLVHLLEKENYIQCIRVHNIQVHEYHFNCYHLRRHYYLYYKQ